jgi:hypothetical protein
LKSTPINGAIIAEWLKNEDGIDVMRTATYVLVGAMYEAIKRHVHDGKLYWDVKPAVLRQREVERIKTTKEYENERTQQRDAVEAAAAKSKEDAATLQRINGMIEAVRITSMGRDQHAKTDEAKAGLRKWRDQLAKAKTPLATIESRIRAAINKIYEAYENGQSYSKSWESGGAI